MVMEEKANLDRTEIIPNNGAEETVSSKNDTVVMENILVVEDEDQLRELLCEILAGEGYMVTSAESADVATEILENSEEEFDLILSDVMMPGKSGLQLLEEIKEKDPLQEFIIMTGYPKVEAAVNAIKIGAFDYISKPFEIAQIRERVSSALKHRKARKAANALDSTIQHGEGTRMLAGYKILRTLGEGTMGIVFLVEKDLGNGPETFAMKIIKNQPLSENKETLQRFFKEAKATSQLKHPNIIHVFEHGYAREENIPYIVMEYFEGKPLKKEIIHPTGLTYKQKMKIVREIASGLASSHSLNIYHRDIKPDNILIDKDYTAKISDFGIAQLPDSNQTNESRIIGTPYYLAPEGYNCPKVDHRADLYSLGTLAYELLLGTKPFDAETIGALGFKVQTENPVEPRKLDRNLPLNIQNILHKLLQKDPKDRYQSAEELIAAIDKAADQGFKKTAIAFPAKWNTLS